MSVKKSNAVKQAEHRARMKVKGFKQILVWTNYLGHIVSANGSNEPDDMEKLSAGQLTGRLKKALDGVNETDADLMRAAIAAYADRLRKRFDVIDRRTTQAANEEFARMEAAKNGTSVEQQQERQKNVLEKVFAKLKKQA